MGPLGPMSHAVPCLLASPLGLMAHAVPCVLASPLGPMAHAVPCVLASPLGPISHAVLVLTLFKFTAFLVPSMEPAFVGIHNFLNPPPWILMLDYRYVQVWLIYGRPLNCVKTTLWQDI